MSTSGLLECSAVALVFALVKLLDLEVLADGYNAESINSTIQMELMEIIDETINKDIEFEELVSGKSEKEIVTGFGSSNEITVNNNRRMVNQDKGGKFDDLVPDVEPSQRSSEYLEHVGAIRRILGGRQATIEMFPYVASILVNDEHWCNGAIITEYYVITAAHCTTVVLPVSRDPVILSKRLKVRTGATTSRGGKVTPVRSLVRHPLFELQPPPHYDVAILELSEDLDIKVNDTTPSVAKKIQLADDMLAPCPQTFVVVCGWGAPKPSSGDRSSNLQTARLKIRTHEYCLNSYQAVSGLYINRDFVCASPLRNATNRRDMCIFDGGAPAVQGDRLVGVMSFGPENCADGPPVVFVRIPPLVSWITAEVKKMEMSRHSK